MKSQNRTMVNSIVNESQMLEKIRELLGLGIEQFVYEMGWPNSKYYDFIKNGRRRNKTEPRKLSHPTIYKIFNGINHAIDTYPHWKEHSSAITSIVVLYLLPSA